MLHCGETLHNALEFQFEYISAIPPCFFIEVWPPYWLVMFFMLRDHDTLQNVIRFFFLGNGVVQVRI